VLVEHHENIGKTIEGWEKAGWRLHTYQTAGIGGAINYTVNHYLLTICERRIKQRLFGSKQMV